MATAGVATALAATAEEGITVEAVELPTTNILVAGRHIAAEAEPAQTNRPLILPERVLAGRVLMQVMPNRMLRRPTAAPHTVAVGNLTVGVNLTVAAATTSNS
jgi:hypothetical protein